MAKQIIKQPNGKYCIFCTIEDNVTFCDMSAEDIIEEWVAESKEEIVKNVKEIIGKLEKDEKPYHQFTKSYADMLNYIKNIHGEKEHDNVKAFIEN